MTIFFHGLHMNGSQWQRPKEFLPQRFDVDDPLYQTSDGKKRHTFAYVPFNGGLRVCFGKTFAEAAMKIMMTYLTTYFNFEHVDEKYRDKDIYPISHIGMQGTKPPVMMKFTHQSCF